MIDREGVRIPSRTSHKGGSLTVSIDKSLSSMALWSAGFMPIRALPRSPEMFAAAFRHPMPPYLAGSPSLVESAKEEERATLGLFGHNDGFGLV